MMVWDWLQREIADFFQMRGLLAIFQPGGWDNLSPLDVFISVFAPLIPILVVIEVILGIVRGNPQGKVYRVNFLIYIANSVLGRLLGWSLVVLVSNALRGFSPLNIPYSWIGFIYGYLVWELAHYLYHFLCHKVRLFWCLHATHHAPEDMNLSVTYAHFYLEIPFAQVMRTTVCVLLGLPLEMLWVIMFIDGVYGAFIHVGANLLPDGSFGPLRKIILTPSHHRVHHGRNPLYIDTNYCNLLNIWDRLFGSYQEEKAEVPVVYGVTRPLDSGSFVDVYVGEICALFADIKKASGLKNRLLYLAMPPGWAPNDFSKTASALRQSCLRGQAVESRPLTSRSL
jgi:sterol desaturase/sphingolipid hydroxylase (fatty acid hydroxylase superfamily)